MPYALKQYDPAKPFLRGGDDNVVDVQDKYRVQSYDLYESVYSNSSLTLKLVLRGDDSYPILMPSGRKIVEATHRFLAQGFDYLVEPDMGDEGVRNALNAYMKSWFARESLKAKFTSNNLWALVRGDGMLMLYATPAKKAGTRISIREIDPRQVFWIEDHEGDKIGCHIVDTVRDFREKDRNTDKTLARRRTFRMVGDQMQPADDIEDGTVTGITTELTFWEIGTWDDRVLDPAEMKRVPNAELDEEATLLPAPITQLPVYHWRNKPPQNSSWGTSQLEGMETLMYALNQSLTDEDATIVFQGLGMYTTNASPPIDPNTGEITDWNIGPMQIIEIQGSPGDVYFNRVSGVQDISPFQEHMKWIDEKGLAEGSGTPEIAIGRVDVTTAESGISLELQLKPLLAANEQKELEIIVTTDQLLHDLVTMWLPAYESDYTLPDGTASGFSAETLSQCSVVCLLSDPMPVNKAEVIQNTLLLQTSHLILRKMAVAKLRSIGWDYPTQDDQGNMLTDDDIADMLKQEAEDDASLGLSALDTGQGQPGQLDQFGNPVQTPPDQQSIPLNAG